MFGNIDSKWIFINCNPQSFFEILTELCKITKCSLYSSADTAKDFYAFNYIMILIYVRSFTCFIDSSHSAFRVKKYYFIWIRREKCYNILKFVCWIFYSILQRDSRNKTRVRIFYLGGTSWVVWSGVRRTAGLLVRRLLMQPSAVCFSLQAS